MAERPDRDEAAEPDRPEGASETPSADAWSDAVDHPHDGPQDVPPVRPTCSMDLIATDGFSGGASSGSREPAPRDPSDDDDDDFGELGAMLQQLLGGGGQGMPDLGELVRQLGGAGAKAVSCPTSRR